jgi:hypothetical protein
LVQVLAVPGAHIPFFVGDPVPRSMVGLLTAVGTAISALVALVHGDAAIVIIAAVAGAATGSATYLALPSHKKNLSEIPN